MGAQDGDRNEDVFGHDDDDDDDNEDGDDGVVDQLGSPDIGAGDGIFVLGKRRRLRTSIH